MLTFNSSLVVVDTLDDSFMSDFLISYSRSLEYLDQYLNKEMIDFSMESADGSNKSGFIQKLKKIIDTIIDFFKNIFERFKNFLKRIFGSAKEKIVSNAKNSATKGSGDSPIYSLNLVLKDWVGEICESMTKEAVDDANVYKNITKKYEPIYKEVKEGKSYTQQTSCSENITDSTIAFMGDEFNRLKRVQQFLAKLNGEKATVSSVQNAVKRGLKSDIDIKSEDGKIVRRQPLIYLDNLIKKEGPSISLESLRAAVIKAAAFVRSQAHCVFVWVKHAVRFSEDVSQKTHKSKGIFKVYTIPTDVKQEISKVYNEFYKGSVATVNASKLIVFSPRAYPDDETTKANINGNSIPMSLLKQAIGGFTMGSAFKNDPGKGFQSHANVQINADMILLGPERMLPFLLGHELGHVADNQHQKINNGKREFVRDRAKNADEYHKNYSKDPMENYANTVGARLMRGASPKFINWCDHIRADIKHIAKEIDYNPKLAIPRWYMRIMLHIENIINHIKYH